LASLRYYILSEKNEEYRKAPSQDKTPSIKFEPENSKLKNSNIAPFMMIICESPIKVLATDIYLNYISKSLSRLTENSVRVH